MVSAILIKGNESNSCTVLQDELNSFKICLIFLLKCWVLYIAYDKVDVPYVLEQLVSNSICSNNIHTMTTSKDNSYIFSHIGGAIPASTESNSKTLVK